MRERHSQSELSVEQTPIGSSACPQNTLTLMISKSNQSQKCHWRAGVEVGALGYNDNDNAWKFSPSVLQVKS